MVKHDQWYIPYVGALLGLLFQLWVGKHDTAVIHRTLQLLHTNIPPQPWNLLGYKGLHNCDNGQTMLLNMDWKIKNSLYFFYFYCAYPKQIFVISPVYLKINLVSPYLNLNLLMSKKITSHQNYEKILTKQIKLPLTFQTPRTLFTSS